MTHATPNPLDTAGWVWYTWGMDTNPHTAHPAAALASARCAVCARQIVLVTTFSPEARPEFHAIHDSVVDADDNDLSVCQILAGRTLFHYPAAGTLMVER